MAKPSTKAPHLCVALIGERPANVKAAWTPANWAGLEAYASKVLTAYLDKAEKVTLVTGATPGLEMAASIAAIKLARDAGKPVTLRVILPFEGKRSVIKTGTRSVEALTPVDHYWDDAVRRVFSTVLKYASVEYVTVLATDSKHADACFEHRSAMIAEAADEMLAGWAGGNNIVAYSVACAATRGKAVGNVWEQVKDLLPTSDDAQPAAKASDDAF